MKVGEFESVRAAAVEAGIVKVPTPLEKAAVSGLTEEERQQQMTSLEQQSAEAGPGEAERIKQVNRHSVFSAIPIASPIRLE
jgi:hypothetical protein